MGCMIHKRQGRQELSSQRGFTLMEVMGVLVVLGLIMAMVVPKVSSIISGSSADVDRAGEVMAETAGEMAFLRGLPSDSEDDTRYSIPTLVEAGYLSVKSGNPMNSSDNYVALTEDGTFKFNGDAFAGGLPPIAGLPGGTGGNGNGTGDGNGNGNGTGDGNGNGNGTGDGDGAGDGDGKDNPPVTPPPQKPGAVKIHQDIPVTDELAARDSDFKFVASKQGSLVKDGAQGYFLYTGNDTVVHIPHTIQGVTITSAYRMFRSSTVEKVINTSPYITDMSYMFEWSTAPRLDLTDLYVVNVTNMSNMFVNAAFATIDVSTWDTSNVEDMSYMFRGLKGGVTKKPVQLLDLSNFNASSVTDFSYMIYSSNVIRADISNMEVAKRVNDPWVNAKKYRILGSKTLDAVYLFSTTDDNLFTSEQGYNGRPTVHIGHHSLHPNQ